MTREYIYLPDMTNQEVTTHYHFDDKIMHYIKYTHDTHTFIYDMTTHISMLINYIYYYYD